MDKIEIDVEVFANMQAELKDLKTFKTNVENENNNVSTEEFSRIENENKVLTIENEKLKKNTETFERETKDNCVKSLIENQKLLPAHKHMAETVYDSYMNQFERDPAKVKDQMNKDFSTTLGIHTDETVPGNTTDEKFESNLTPSDHSQENKEATNGPDNKV